VSALARIEAYKRDEIAKRKAARPFADMMAAAKSAIAPRGFLTALQRGLTENGMSLIAEIKKASPSKGLIRAEFDPSALARDYQSGGAHCLSVLTDGPSFQGDGTYLEKARSATSLPALRKDFMLDPWQVVESRALGADAILVILASVDDVLARELIVTAHDLGMDALIETHDANEIERAIKLPSPLIGINNRNLKTFVTSLTVFENLAPMIPADRFVIAESGIANHDDLIRLKTTGAKGLLVGESLMRQSNVEMATQQLLGA